MRPATERSPAPGANQTYTPGAELQRSGQLHVPGERRVNDSNLATVSITVNPVNDPPVASPNSALLAEDSFALVPLPATDVDGDPLTYSIVDQPRTARSRAPARTAPTRRPPNYNGPDSFTFKANDGTADSNTATVSLTVTAGERRAGRGQRRGVRRRGRLDPGARARERLGRRRRCRSSVTSVGSPAHGTAVLQGDGTVLYTPDANYNGGDSFTYAISDGNGGTDSATVSADGHAGQRRAGGTDSEALVAQDTPEDIPLVATDPDGDTLGYTSSRRLRTARSPARARRRRTRRTALQRPGLVHLQGQRRHRRLERRHDQHHRHAAAIPPTVTSTMRPRRKAIPASATPSSPSRSPRRRPTRSSSTWRAPTGRRTSLSDYGAMTTRLTFAPSQTSKTVVVKVHGDTLDELDESYFVNITVVSGDVMLGDGQGVGTIVDDDPLAGLSIGDTSVTEGNSGTTTATLEVTLSAASSKTITVDYATADGTANEPSDYSSTSGTLTFAPGQMTKDVTVSVNGDTEVEPDETFPVELTNATNATIENGTGVGTILNDDFAAARRLRRLRRHHRHRRLRRRHLRHLRRLRHHHRRPPPPVSRRAEDAPRLPLHDHRHAQARRPARHEAARRHLRARRRRHAERPRRKRRADRRPRQRPARRRSRAGPPDRRGRR